MAGYEKTIGTLLVGIIFNTFLYGLVMFQFASYYRTKFNDPRPIKLMVLFLFIIDNVHSVAVIYMLWEICVTNFDNPDILNYALWPYPFTPIATALAAFATQVFLGYRIFRLTKNTLLYGFIVFLAVPSFALGMACGIRAWIINVLAELVVLGPLVTAWLSMQVGIDMFITVTLSLTLWRSRTGFRRTDTVLNRLIRGAIQTGLFAGIFSMGDLATFLKYPDTNFYGMFAIPIGRIYTNTLLDTLLARDELRDRLGGAMDVEESNGAKLSDLRWSPGTKGSGAVAGASTGAIQLNEIGARQKAVTFDDDDGARHYLDDVSLKKGPLGSV
ncbi:hypothetical protein BXZ70DRAFT_1034476 [Cristinia sonorae]|uniref:DUF6534 domain-containing protein n=1 Tax=Cristinia sonorae TaxID=1940300 RepID=A0A8K0UJ87_9AGAR|nr:hypothetical protein BXZ70DRAFT_1034476 [Cristinia sonorae]